MNPKFKQAKEIVERFGICSIHKKKRREVQKHSSKGIIGSYWGDPVCDDCEMDTLVDKNPELKDAFSVLFGRIGRDNE
jgi:hypothetical protein